MKLTTKMQKIPFNEIKPDPVLIPEVLKHKEIKPDYGREEQFFRLMTETGYVEPLRVCSYKGIYLLLPPYESYLARKKIIVEDYSQLVDCILIEGGEWKELLLLSCRLNSFSGQGKSHLNRLVTLDLLYRSCGLNIKKIRTGMGITESNSIGKRQLQKDLRLIRCPELLSRVIGVDLNEGEWTCR